MRFLRYLGFVWAAPLSLAGLIVGWFLGAGDGQWLGNAYVLRTDTPRIFGGYYGVTYGNVVLLSSEAHPTTIVHEMVHVYQCMILGPLMVLAYPLASLIARLQGGSWYRDNWFEKQARRYAGQK